jgi:hypothetical protein
MSILFDEQNLEASLLHEVGERRTGGTSADHDDVVRASRRGLRARLRHPGLIG